MKKFWDVLGEILAVVLVVTYALWILNLNFNFIAPNTVVFNIIQILRNYGSLALIGIVGFEAMAKRGFIFKIIFLAMIALIVIFMFFPETYSSLFSKM